MNRHTKALRIEMRWKLQNGSTFRSLATEYGISTGDTYRIADPHDKDPGCSYEPKKEATRDRLGYPQMGLGERCRKCGDVHTTKVCTKGRREAMSRTPLADLPTKILKWKLENREVLKE